MYIVYVYFSQVLHISKWNLERFYCDTMHTAYNLPFLSVESDGIKHIHTIAQPSPPHISRSFCLPDSNEMPAAHSHPPGPGKPPLQFPLGTLTRGTV